MHALWARLHDAVMREGRAALVTVLAVEGSAPREAGARMIVTEAGLRGTIGGGTLEHESWQSARALLRSDNPEARVTRAVLGPDLGQCCGGRVTLGLECFSAADAEELAGLAAREANGLVLQTVFGEGAHAHRTATAAGAEGVAIEAGEDGIYIERFREMRPLIHLFGAGHVGTALVMALAPLPFRVVWHDQRAELFPERIPANAEMRLLGDPEALAFQPDESVLVMTHSHPLDLAIVAAALRSPCRFIGLIGSATKKARFVSRLRAAGFSQDALQRIVCPIGVPGVEGKEPAVIAASVAAQMLLERQPMAASHETLERPHHARVAMRAAE